MQNLNWYPGHMKKTEKLLDESLKLIDIVLELRDARIPDSSANPMIADKIKRKKRIVLLNKIDLADSDENEKWKAKFKNGGLPALGINSLTGEGVNELTDMMRRYNDRERPPRIMVAGIPNVGKSSLINRLAGRKGAMTGNRPGVTKGKQWINLQGKAQLLDTPGILWPKFADPEVGRNLAFCGSIRDEIFDIEELAYEFIGWMIREYPQALKERYSLSDIGDDTLEVMNEIAVNRGFLKKGGNTDYNRTAVTVMDEFRRGKLGRITIEKA